MVAARAILAALLLSCASARAQSTLFTDMWALAQPDAGGFSVQTEGLAFWFKARESSDGLVATATDYSPVGRSIAQTNSANQPMRTTNESGYAYITNRASGSGAFMVIDPPIAPATNTYVFTAFRRRAAGAQFADYGVSADTARPYLWYIDNRFLGYWGGSQFTYSTNSGYGDFISLCFRDAGTATLVLNGATQAVRSISGGTTPWTWLGRSGSGYFNGGIYESLVYTGVVLTAEYQSSLINYLKSTNGITW